MTLEHRAGLLGLSACPQLMPNPRMQFKHAMVPKGLFACTGRIGAGSCIQRMLAANVQMGHAGPARAMHKAPALSYMRQVDSSGLGFRQFRTIPTLPQSVAPIPQHTY
jgi:hypothetical protein